MTAARDNPEQRPEPWFVTDAEIVREFQRRGLTGRDAKMAVAALEKQPGWPFRHRNLMERRIGMYPKIADAPGLRWRQRKGGVLVALWIARLNMVKRGYRPETQELWRGRADELDDIDAVRIQAECIRLQDEMSHFLSGGHRMPTFFDGTIGALVDFYQGDKDSPYHKLRYASRRSYDQVLRTIKAKVGARHLASITFRDLNSWYEKARWPKGEDGPDQPYSGHFFMTAVRFLVKFGIVAELYKPDETNHCLRLSTILSKMEFEKGTPRTLHLDREMAERVIAEAHRQGRPSIALAQAFAPKPAVKRKPLTKAQRKKLLADWNGCCCICEDKIRDGEPWQDEHIIALHHGGGNEWTNRGPAHVRCALGKNKTDAKISAKGRRLRGETCAKPRGRPIQNRGFQKRTTAYVWATRKFSHPSRRGMAERAERADVGNDGRLLARYVRGRL